MSPRRARLAPCALVALLTVACGPDPGECGLEKRNDLSLGRFDHPELGEIKQTASMPTRIVWGSGERLELGRNPETGGGGVVSLTARLESDQELVAVWVPGSVCGQFSDQVDCASLPRSEIVAAQPGDVVGDGIEVLARFSAGARVRVDHDDQGPGNLVVVPVDPDQPYELEGEATIRWFEAPAWCGSVSLSQLQRFCGDGLVTLDETCDDENQTDGDGCSASCRVESPTCQDPDAGGLTVWSCPLDAGPCTRVDCVADPAHPDCEVPQPLEVVTLASGRWTTPADAPAVLVDGVACRCGGDGLLDATECAETCAPTGLACTPVALEAATPASLVRWYSDGLVADCSSDPTCTAVAATSAQVVAELSAAPHGVQHVADDLVGWAQAHDVLASPRLAVGPQGQAAVFGELDAPITLGATTIEAPGSLLVLFDGDGNRVATHVFSGATYELSLRDAVWLDTGALVVVGAARGVVDLGRGVVLDVPTSQPDSRQAFAAAWDARGTPLWTRHLQRAEPYTIETLAVASGGAGQVAVFGGLGAPGIPASHDSARVLRAWRLDTADGEVLGGGDVATGTSAHAIDVELAADGRLWLLGDGWLDDIHQPGASLVPPWIIHLDAADARVFATLVDGARAHALEIDGQSRPWVVVNDGPQLQLHVLSATNGAIDETHSLGQAAAADLVADPSTDTMLVAASHTARRQLEPRGGLSRWRARRAVTVERVDAQLETVWVERFAWLVADEAALNHASAPAIGVDAGGRPVLAFDTPGGHTVGDVELTARDDGALARAIVWLQP